MLIPAALFHRFPAAHVHVLALAGRTPSSRFDVVSATTSASLKSVRPTITASWRPKLPKIGETSRPGERERGFTLFEALVTIALLGVLSLGVVAYVERLGMERREAAAARDLGTLARAARAHAAHDIGAMRIAAGGSGLREVTLAELESSGWLHSGFPVTNDLGQGYRIFHRRTGSDGLEVLVSTVTPTGEERGLALRAGYDSAADVFIGTVRPTAPTRVRGPALDADVSSYQGAFGEPSPGEMAALCALTMRGSYGSQLYRVALTGWTEGNTMRTDLSLGGEDLRGVGDIEARAATVEETLEVLGNAAVHEELTVGTEMTVAGKLEVAGTLEVAALHASSGIDSASATVHGALQARRASVAESVEAKTFTVDEHLSASSASLGRVEARTLQAGRVVSNDIETRDAAVRVLRTGTIRATRGTYRSLQAESVVTTGS